MWVQMVSHKLLRLACPFALLVLFLTSAVLATSSDLPAIDASIWRTLALSQLLFYAAAAAGARAGRIGALARTFTVLNAAAVAGLPLVLEWGVIAFVLNYIPYLGPLAMNLVLFAVGIVTFPTLGQALVAPACFIAMTTLEGHFITPSIMGRRLTLNPLNVFLALAFWTWLWGPIGAFLAVPLLITALVSLKHAFPQPEINLPS